MPGETGESRLIYVVASGAVFCKQQGCTRVNKILMRKFTSRAYNHKNVSSFWRPNNKTWTTQRFKVFVTRNRATLMIQYMFNTSQIFKSNRLISELLWWLRSPSDIFWCPCSPDMRKYLANKNWILNLKSYCGVGHFFVVNISASVRRITDSSQQIFLAVMNCRYGTTTVALIKIVFLMSSRKKGSITRQAP